MGLLSKNDSKPVAPMDFDVQSASRSCRFGIVGCEYATSDGPSGTKLIKRITGNNGGWYQGTLKPCTYKMKPAAKACLKDSSGKYIHVGWIPKEKAPAVIKMIVREKGNIIYEYNSKSGVLAVHVYWE